MGLLPQNPRNQKLVVVALLAVGLGVSYQQLVWTPKNVELTAVAVRLDTLDSLNKMAKREVAKGSASKMKQEAEAFRRELEVLRRLVPTENEVPALLESVASAARRAGLELADVQPDGVANGDEFNTYKYKLGLTGPFHEVTEFLSNVGSLSRIVAPINVSIVPSTRPPNERRPKKNQQFVDARFQIQTYVARTSPKVPAPTGKVGSP